MDETIKVLIVEPLKAPYEKEIKHDLETLQKEVGGYIEVTYQFEDRVGIICNEEGKLLGLKSNRALYDDDGKIYDVISGTFLVVGLGDEDFTSLNDNQIDKFSEMFKSPEIFRNTPSGIMAIKIETAASLRGDREER